MANLTPKNLYIGDDTAANVYTVSSSSGSYTILRNIDFTDMPACTVVAVAIVDSGTIGAGNVLVWGTLAVRNGVGVFVGVGVNVGVGVFVGVDVLVVVGVKVVVGVCVLVFVGV